MSIGSSLSKLLSETVFADDSHVKNNKSETEGEEKYQGELNGLPPNADQDVPSLQGWENLGLPDALSVNIEDQGLQTLESLDLILLGEMKFPKVKSLVLKWTNLKVLEIPKLKALGAMFPNLESLDLTGVKLNDEGLKALVSSLSRLKSLDLSLCSEEITDNGLKDALSSPSLESLEILDLSESSAITNRFFEVVLSSLSGLKSLNLSFCTNDDFTLEKVVLPPWFSLKSPNLETLDLSQSLNVTDVGLKAVLPYSPSFSLGSSRWYVHTAVDRDRAKSKKKE
jgi:hypothetical protein